RKGIPARNAVARFDLGETTTCRLGGLSGKSSYFRHRGNPRSTYRDFADFAPGSQRCLTSVQMAGNGPWGCPFPSARPAIERYHNAIAALRFLHFEVPGYPIGDFSPTAQMCLTILELRDAKLRHSGSPV